MTKRSSKVTIDGSTRATVHEHFPDGSTSYLFPHYSLNIVNGERRVVVASYRVTRADDYGVTLDSDGYPVGR